MSTICWPRGCVKPSRNSRPGGDAKPSRDSLPVGGRKALLEHSAGGLSPKTLLPVGVKFAAARANFMTTGTFYSHPMRQIPGLTQGPPGAYLPGGDAKPSWGLLAGGAAQNSPETHVRGLTQSPPETHCGGAAKNPLRLRCWECLREKQHEKV